MSGLEIIGLIVVGIFVLGLAIILLKAAFYGIVGALMFGGIGYLIFGESGLAIGGLFGFFVGFIGALKGDAEKNLKRRLHEIDQLFQVSNELFGMVDRENLINTALLIIVGQLGADSTFALLLNEEDETYSDFYSKGLKTSVLSYDNALWSSLQLRYKYIQSH